MTALEAIEQRRAIKHYDPNHRLTETEVRQLLTLAMQSPTAFNIQHGRFVVVSDAALRRQIRAVAWDQAQLWGDYISTPEHRLHMTYPRGAALAEVLWPPKADRDHDGFL